MKPVSATRADLERAIAALHASATAERRLAEYGSDEWRTKHSENAKRDEAEIKRLRRELRHVLAHETVVA